MSGVLGLHHITAICGDPQENVDFYAGILGMRLVKRSVNQDDPFTYHFFYADGAGTPGTDLTFFPWPHLPPARHGPGVAVEVALAVPAGTLAYWAERLEQYGVAVERLERRFGERALLLTDPHGMRLALVETAGREAVPWAESPVPPDQQIRGLHSARVLVHRLGPTAAFLERVLGLELVGVEAGWRRYGLAGGQSGTLLDVCEVPNGPSGQWGVGGVHHIAWRVADENHQQALRERVERAGQRPTPVINRFWFKSVYFFEPGGVLFELATDGPGFAVDEDPAHLGESLILPPWLESHRAVIEDRLPAIRYPPLVPAPSGTR